MNSIPIGESIKDKSPKTYIVLPGSIAASGQTSIPLVLDANSTFKLYGFQASTDLDLVTSNNPSFNNFKFRIQVNNSWYLSNDYIPQRLGTGNSYQPLWIPECVYFDPNSILNFEFVNLSAGSAVVITFAMVGMAYYL